MYNNITPTIAIWLIFCCGFAPLPKSAVFNVSGFTVPVVLTVSRLLDPVLLAALSSIRGFSILPLVKTGWIVFRTHTNNVKRCIILSYTSLISTGNFWIRVAVVGRILDNIERIVYWTSGFDDDPQSNAGTRHTLDHFSSSYCNVRTVLFDIQRLDQIQEVRRDSSQCIDSHHKSSTWKNMKDGRGRLWQTLPGKLESYAWLGSDDEVDWSQFWQLRYLECREWWVTQHERAAEGGF